MEKLTLITVYPSDDLYDCRPSGNRHSLYVKDDVGTMWADRPLTWQVNLPIQWFDNYEFALPA